MGGVRGLWRDGGRSERIVEGWWESERIVEGWWEREDRGGMVGE